MKTIKQNITYRIKEAANITNAHHFISRSLNKYDTQVSPNSMELTLGQKLITMVARVVLKNTSILLLDEVDGTIKHESRRVVHVALNMFLISSKTTILVVRKADIGYLSPFCMT